MKFLRFLDFIDKMMSNIHTEPNLCTKIISPLSKCTKCVDICPFDSISIRNEKIELDENCVNCGLCTTVCPTNALQLQKPSLQQLMDEAKRKSKQYGYVYIQCSRHKIKENGIAATTVPCLGAIPKENWMSLIKECDDLSIYSFDDACKKCELKSGEEVWKEELALGESFAGKKVPIHAKATREKEKDVQYDINRRELFSTLFSEVKSTNKLAIKEFLGASQTLSRKEKYKDTPETKMKKELEQFSKMLAEKITNESSYPYMNQRKLFLRELKSNEELRSREDVRLPEITEDCTYCGACAILCPTDSLRKVENEELTAMTLEPYKCIECNLCVDICYFKSISLKNTQNDELFSEVKVLLKKEKESEPTENKAIS